MAFIPETPFSNILDYINWRGDIPISAQFPINILDRAIFARYSYMNFNAIGYGDVETIGALSYELAKLSDDKFLLADDRELAKATAHAVRYKDLAVTDIVINNDPEAEKQFGAITILLPNNTLYISYLGTDDMLFSWKEDFNMTFMDTIPSQIDGLAYLNHIAEKFPKYKMLLGGHSKGGNIAMFAALSADKSIQERIISIDNFDGPGFDQDRAQFRKNPEIMQKITSYFPQESMVGRLLDHEETVRIVESVEVNIMQHDLYSWRVENLDFVDVKNVKQVKYVFNKAMRAWLHDCTIEQRKFFIDSIYEAVIAADYNKLSDIRRNPLKAAPAVYKAYKSGTTPEERKEITKIAKIFINNYLEIRKNNDKEYQIQNKKAHKSNAAARRAKNKALLKAGKKVPKAFFQK